ncbi:hypothetical protein P872_18885 [Rhodonellum psychrophilum GCM71 = DSM 17998]|uniref:Uncharacterized protein n=2 Tax=Cytophagaceae TaxID=89373 RepID=U5BNX4_9BACT|nr:hypothetical protein P872_18885 [Rhodonellum psychrophilum GCM71 = DSM 17998]
MLIFKKNSISKNHPICISGKGRFAFVCEPASTDREIDLKSSRWERCHRFSWKMLTPKYALAFPMGLKPQENQDIRRATELTDLVNLKIVKKGRGLGDFRRRRIGAA